MVSADIVELDELEDLVALAELFASVWGRPGQPPINSDILKALSHSGNYVAGAYAGPRLVGGLVGWFGGSPRHELHLHSHILGVLPESDARGIGWELKQHQRRWCLERGVKTIEWTTDPLVRRNAYFNLTKLGAAAPRYLVNVYGEMRDGINAGEESDRLLVRWRLDSRRAESAAAGDAPEPDVERLRREGAAAILHAGSEGQPVTSSSDAATLLCQIPADIVAVRKHDPAQARAWRVALRHCLMQAMERGYALTGATKSGWYVLEASDH